MTKGRYCCESPSVDVAIHSAVERTLHVLQGRVSQRATRHLWQYIDTYTPYQVGTFALDVPSHPPYGRS